MYLENGGEGGGDGGSDGFHSPISSPESFYSNSFSSTPSPSSHGFDSSFPKMKNLEAETEKTISEEDSSSLSSFSSLKEFAELENFISKVKFNLALNYYDLIALFLYNELWQIFEKLFTDYYTSSINF